MNYKDSGVDPERSYQLVQRIQQQTRPSSKQANVLEGVGGFAALYALSGYQDPVLVSGTDGVGTKLKLAFDFGVFHSVGRDCVAMCVNDVLCAGAEPLFFLDYLSCDHLDLDIAGQLIEGISAACASIDIPLIGGETAEMPGFYKDGLYDLAGFCVGVVERSQIRGREHTRAGDIIIGLSSSGLHSNGFSLVRKVLAECEQHYGTLDYDKPLIVTESGKKSLKDVLLEPTALYSQLLHKLLGSQWGDYIHSMSNITGGGIYENLPRALGIGLCAEIYRDCLHIPMVFDFIQNPGKYLAPESGKQVAETDAKANPQMGPGLEPMVSTVEMWNTFNMGLGFAIIVAEEAAEGILQVCNQYAGLGQELISGGEIITATIVGRVLNHDNPDQPQVSLCH